MGKREKILVGLMVVALLYAGFELVYRLVETGPEIQQQVDAAGTQELAAIAGQAMQEASLEERQLHVLKAASAPWVDSPFAVLPTPAVDPEEVDTDFEVVDAPEDRRIPLFYSGYMEMGDRRLAVINGIEYRPGEEMSIAGLILESIEPHQVVVRCTQRQEVKTVPYEERVYLD